MNIAKMLDFEQKVPLWLLIPPAILVVIYGFLSNLAFTDPTFFYESMTIPIPEHGFMLLSWGGKNTAIVVGLILAMVSRRLQTILMMMVVLLTMQFGDINAGARTNVNVFVTYIGMGFVILELVLIGVWQSRTATKAAPATA